MNSGVSFSRSARHFVAAVSILSLLKYLPKVASRKIASARRGEGRTRSPLRSTTRPPGPRGHRPDARGRTQMSFDGDRKGLMNLNLSIFYLAGRVCQG